MHAYYSVPSPPLTLTNRMSRRKLLSMTRDELMGECTAILGDDPHAGAIVGTRAAAAASDVGRLQAAAQVKQEPAAAASGGTASAVAGGGSFDASRSGAGAAATALRPAHAFAAVVAAPASALALAAAGAPGLLQLPDTQVLAPSDLPPELADMFRSQPRMPQPEREREAPPVAHPAAATTAVPVGVQRQQLAGGRPMPVPSRPRVAGTQGGGSGLSLLDAILSSGSTRAPASAASRTGTGTPALSAPAASSPARAAAVSPGSVPRPAMAAPHAAAPAARSASGPSFMHGLLGQLLGTAAPRPSGGLAASSAPRLSVMLPGGTAPSAPPLAQPVASAAVADGKAQASLEDSVAAPAASAAQREPLPTSPPTRGALPPAGQVVASHGGLGSLRPARKLSLHERVAALKSLQR